jgi:hypothetical protein
MQFLSKTNKYTIKNRRIIELMIKIYIKFIIYNCGKIYRKNNYTSVKNKLL